MVADLVRQPDRIGTGRARHGHVGVATRVKSERPDTVLDGKLAELIHPPENGRLANGRPVSGLEDPGRADTPLLPQVAHHFGRMLGQRDLTAAGVVATLGDTLVLLALSRGDPTDVDVLILKMQPVGSSAGDRFRITDFRIVPELACFLSP